MGLTKETLLTNEEIKYITEKIDRVYRIDKIRRIKKLKKWLRCHTN